MFVSYFPDKSVDNSNFSSFFSNLFISFNNGSVAGQEVPHAHLHIIPRFVDDKVLLGASQKKYEGEELDEMKEKIQAKIAAREEGA